MSDIQVQLQASKRLHFMGIGGSGICPLVEILHSRGYQISGSDNNPGDTLERIKAMGIPVVLEQTAENIVRFAPDMLVYSAAIPQNNPELAAARATGIPCFERAKLLSALTQGYENCICVSGTHGKTTVTAMITQILLEAQKNPSAIVGGKLACTGTNGINGGKELMVVEACEFQDTFLELLPDIVVILNVDEDHMEYFKTLERILASFHAFADKAAKAIVVNGDDRNSLEALEGIVRTELVTYGKSSGNVYTAHNIRMVKGFATFDMLKSGRFYENIRLNVPGEHNVSNALAAIATAFLAGVSLEQCIASVQNFRGAGRRFEIVAREKGLVIADDYAHHPKELEATLHAAKAMGFQRVWAVFQPFTYSRTALLFDDFVRVLQIADRVVMSEIMGAREENTQQIYTAQLAEKIPGSVWFESFDAITDYVLQQAEEGDLVLTLGCGDIYKVAKQMAQRLRG